MERSDLWSRFRAARGERPVPTLAAEVIATRAITDLMAYYRGLGLREDEDVTVRFALLLVNGDVGFDLARLETGASDLEVLRAVGLLADRAGDVTDDPRNPIEDMRLLVAAHDAIEAWTKALREGQADAPPDLRFALEEAR